MASSIRTAALLVLLPAFLGLLAPACTADNILYSGETLHEGQSLTYDDYVLAMQQDCNLVLYDNGEALWSTKTNGMGSKCFVRLDSDGNLVLCSNNGNVLWQTNTRGEEGHYVLILQKDRNVVIYGPNIWATNTPRPGPRVVAAAAKDLNNRNRKIAMLAKN